MKFIKIANPIVEWSWAASVPCNLQVVLNCSGFAFVVAAPRR